MKCRFVPLGNFADFNPPAPHAFPHREGEVSFVPMSDVSEDGSMSALQHRQAGALNGGYSYFQSGDVLVAKITPCFENNKITVAEIDRRHGFGSTEFHVIRPRAKELDARYLLHFLRQDSVRAEGQRRMTGSAGQRRVPRLFFEELEIPLPPLDEQRRIASILDRADALRRKRRGAMVQVEEIRRGIFIEMFVKNERDDWQTLSIADIAQDTRTGPFGSQLLHSEFVETGVPVLGIDNAVSNEFRWGARRYISASKYEQLRRYSVRPGDVLITIMGTCGRCAVVPDDIGPAINTKHLCCIRLRSTLMLPVFLHAAFLHHPEVLNQLGIQARGAVMPGLNMSIIRALRFCVPPLSVQREFERCLKFTDQFRLNMRAQELQLRNLYIVLQHRAFRGEL